MVSTDCFDVNNSDRMVCKFADSVEMHAAFDAEHAGRVGDRKSHTPLDDNDSSGGRELETFTLDLGVETVEVEMQNSRKGGHAWRFSGLGYNQSRKVEKWGEGGVGRRELFSVLQGLLITAKFMRNVKKSVPRFGG